MRSQFVFLTLTFFLGAACDAPPKVEVKGKEARVERKQVKSVEKIADHIAEITFSPGQKSLSSLAKETIRKYFQRASQGGTIQAVKILTWADKISGNDQLKLVEDRNDSLESYLEKLDISLRVNKISMAEDPEVMESILSEQDFELLKYYASSKSQPLPSKSIVKFVVDDKK